MKRIISSVLVFLILFNVSSNLYLLTYAKNASGEEFEALCIKSDYEYFGLNGRSGEWQVTPRERKNILRVPLRQFSEIMGWDVKWDADTSSAIVISDNTIKTFEKNNDMYEILYRDNNDRKKFVLTNSLEIIDDLMYIDIDALLKDSGYSYYIRDEWYWIKETNKVMESVAASKIFELYELIPSADIIGSEAYKAKVAENEAMIMFATNEDGSWYYTVMVPAAEQAVYGNFNNEEVTWEGTFTQIIVGELPGVGTAADIRDVVADFKNWEWSWAHVGTTALDMVGIIPLIGAVKYTDEVASLVKGGTKLMDSGTEIVQETLKQSNHIDDLIDVSQTAIKQVDEVSKYSTNFISIENPILDNIRTGSALKIDELHAFNKIIDNYAGNAHKFSIIGNDGIERSLYQLNGSLNGKDGIFEWIVDPNPAKGVTHRRFIEGVEITGRPNATP